MPSPLSRKIAEALDAQYCFMATEQRLCDLADLIERAGVGELEAMVCLSDAVRIKDLEVRNRVLRQDVESSNRLLAQAQAERDALAKRLEAVVAYCHDSEGRIKTDLGPAGPLLRLARGEE